MRKILCSLVLGLYLLLFAVLNLYLLGQHPLVNVDEPWYSDAAFNFAIDLQKKFRVPLRGQRTERLTVARHQSHDLVGHLSKVQQCFVHLCL